MDPKKVAGVMDWPTPAKVKDVQAFVGFANYYRRFIKDFSKVVKPLTELSKKNTQWNWGPEQAEAFQTLKEAFTSAPILRIPDQESPFRVEADSSDYATGAVLSQYSSEDKLWHPVAFYSKSLSAPERNYEIYDKELLAIIRALEEWRHYLEGHPHKFEVWSDHLNLTYFKSAQRLTRRQARWSLYLTRFNFTMCHKPGKTMLTADPLSRRPDHEEGVELDNRDQILLKPEYFTVRALEASQQEIQSGDEDLLRQIRQALMDDQITKDYQELLKSGPKEFGKDLQEWNMEAGLLLRRGKVYVPKEPKELRTKILELHHDHVTAGHFGRWKTYELLSRNYWWPGMTTMVKQYVEGCDTCQRMKNRNQTPYGPLQLLPVPEAPWDTITIDFIVHLPPSGEFKQFTAIMVVVDRLTKRAHFIPTSDNISAKELANLLYLRIYPNHGLPKQIISDRGPQFSSELFKGWCEQLGIQRSMTTAYHPQADGQTERINQILEQYLRCYIDIIQKDNWVFYLPTAEFAYNNAASETTKNSPFFVELGRHPNAGPTDLKPTQYSDLNQFAYARWSAQEQAKAAMKLAAERWSWYYDQHKRSVPFKVGDKVLVDARSWQDSERSLSPRYLGPFKIIEQLSPVTFRVHMDEQYRAYHPVFHASKLVMYKDPVHQKKPEPQPEMVDGEELWEVEKILDHRLRAGRVEYRIRWKGFGINDDSWVREADLDTAYDILQEYKASHAIPMQDVPLRRSARRKEAVHVFDPDSDDWEADECTWPDDWPQYREKFAKDPKQHMVRHPDGGWMSADINQNADLKIVVGEGGRMPEKGTKDSVGFDLYTATGDVLPAHGQTEYNTKLKIQVPFGTYGRIAPRSSLAHKGIDVMGGVIDHDYQGEVIIILRNHSDISIDIRAGDKIAQLICEVAKDPHVTEYPGGYSNNPRYRLYGRR